ncbi:MAG: TIGR03984 family CRISPR-associated protein [Blastochloris sp.]|nr:TIGR03984 family CRISPR-associated protein [Blastochloris sp.]
MIQRNIQSLSRIVTRLAPPTNLLVQPWLTTVAQAQQFQQGWFLAHTERGVVWGKYDQGQLHLDDDSHAAWLTWDLLHQGRLFCQDRELLLWPGPGGWQAQVCCDDITGNTIDYIDEEQLLWGDRADVGGPTTTAGFLSVQEGSRGIRHAPPIAQPPSRVKKANEYQRNRARLLVRHYLQTDSDTGLVRIAHSRLVAVLEPEEEQTLTPMDKEGENK